ncbi:ABC transporter ATP-binding protein [Limnochorda pilosa]|uniref:MFS transporter n=1 Tax=Limnochorda pilosa TaxID=1555112 RepID=A0A0K2SFT1_LIMPI|nr:ABC transporter ATP-binding protein [Limnochorda pilosa]BAS25892.1 MFS transporter [Limnochorda pilosa]
MIRLEHVSKRYAGRSAVEDLSFEVGEGEVVGFLGPNGAGKTTTMRIITGYMPPSEGRVELAGFDPVENPTEVKSRIGYLPENPPVYPEMTVLAYLRFVSDLKRIPRPQRTRQVEQAMERTDLGPARGRLIGHLSRGYRQRVGLAQALLGEPPVLILDEPTVGLDPQQIIEIRQLIRELSGAHTVLLSSHVLPEVQALCERVIIINRGRLVAEDRTENLGHSVRSGGRLELVVRAGGAQVVQRLQQLPEVERVEAVGEAASGETRLRVDERPGSDARPALFFALAEAGWPILELTRPSLSLEEVFVHLVTQETTPEENAAGQEGVSA